MTKPMHKSRTLRRTHKRIIGSTVARYTAKKSGGAICSKCKQNLKGGKLGLVAKTERRAERAFGGYLCANCVKQKLITEARQLSFKKE